MSRTWFLTLSPTAQAVLDQSHKDLGALVIDMGGGTTDYMVYLDGAVKYSGVLAVGGDHISNDLTAALRIPLARSERLKIDEGNVLLGQTMPGESVILKGDAGFAGKEVEREMLSMIIHMRVREVMELLKRRLEEQRCLDFLGAGVFLTGGCSQLKGITALAEEVFGLPVHTTRAQSLAGVTSAFENPQFSTAIGLVRYAQADQIGRPTGLLSRLKKGLRIFGSF